MIVGVFAMLNRADESRDVLREMEAASIRQALDACGGNVTQAAKRLGIHRQSLQRKIRRLM